MALTKIIAMTVLTFVIVNIVELCYSQAKSVNPMLQKTHGCHRFLKISPLTTFNHLHTGPNCVRAGFRKLKICIRWAKICRNRCVDLNIPHLPHCRSTCIINSAPRFCFSARGRLNLTLG
ncbi:MAG: hypothetical protein TECD_01044 [Hyphomicrobiaceae bacterium hypho_1]